MPDYIRPQTAEHLAWTKRAHHEHAAGVLGAYRRMPAEVLADLSLYCGDGETTHVAGDPYESAFREGQRSVWLRVRALSELDDHTKEMLEAKK